jgi:pimeloyl-ACP methyl ester carboxylesterase
MKRLGAVLLVLIAALGIAFLALRTPDTDPAAMRAKYGAAPSQFVDLGAGLTVHLRDEGPRDAPAIVLLHGSNADLHTWEPWAAALRSDYRVIRFDTIGHGLTGAAPGKDYSAAAMAALVGRVADKLAIGKFVLGGNSMGGGISVAYALKHQDRLTGRCRGRPQTGRRAGKYRLQTGRHARGQPDHEMDHSAPDRRTKPQPVGDQPGDRHPGCGRSLLGAAALSRQPRGNSDPDDRGAPHL